jgi:photosystem II stability/assembly factor-like uncharacterized protein
MMNFTAAARSRAKGRPGQADAHLKPVWILLLAACAGCGSDRGPAGPVTPRDTIVESGWQIVATSPTSPTASRHDDIVFVGSERGWLVNTRGEIHRTDDGAATWTRIHSANNTFYRAVGFATETRGWVGNLNFFNNPIPDVALFETGDGGVSWTNITSRIAGVRPVGICGLQVLDAQTIFAVGRWNGPAVFVRSLDGGATWAGIDLAPLATGLVDVHFFNRDEGIIVGGRGVGNAAAAQDSSRTVILTTDDGGTTWTTRYVSAARGKWAWKISFPSRQVGYVSTQGGTTDGVVVKTMDGGRTWVELGAAPGFGFSGIGFIDEQTGWVTADTTAYATNNGGAAWHEVRLGRNVNKFRFVSPTLGFAAGDAVYRYQLP